MKKYLLVVVVLGAAYFGLAREGNSPWDETVASTRNVDATSEQPSAGSSRREEALARAFAHRTSNVQVEGRGIVIEVLADDNDGSRHQRFIIELDSGQTLLVTHNIDLAPRVAALGEGDAVGFHGEYEWNPQGGIIHWTHHDPDGQHSGGWIRHEGRTYQ